MAESNPSRGTYYITTPIYYVNDRPHIGHVYTTTIADIAARHHRFLGQDTFFLTGTDEHAAKVVDAAAERGLTPQQWADQNAAEFDATFRELGMSNDDFIRTTEPRHKERVTQYVTALLESGDVYLGDYEGWYDAGQEEYIPDNKANEYDYKSPINGKPLVRKTEKNYFFRLSAYREPLLKHFAAHPDFVQPDVRKNEIVKRIEEAGDVPMSRTGSGDHLGGWGIPVPGHEEHTIYVWIDALFNYLTTVDTDDRRKYWQSGPVHLIAKDILWFHAAIWPAVLLALQKCDGYEWVNPPRQVYCHSFWISEGQKMSKTLGNFIDLEAIRSYVEVYGLDALRYFLATQGPLGATDSNFAAEKFHEVYSSDLVNTIGNCASRVAAMIGKYFDGVVPDAGATGGPVLCEHDWPAICADAVRESCDAMDRLDLAGGISAAVALVRRVDGFINATEPFKLAKDETKRDELSAILYQCAEALRIASLLLWPALPNTMPQFWAAYGQEVDPASGGLNELVSWGGLQPGTAIRKVALFPRVELATA